MAIRSNNVSKNAAFAREPIQFSPVNGIASQTGKVVSSMTIPYPFQIVSVEGFCMTTTGTITYDVQIGTTTALSAGLAMTAATKTAGSLSATAANTRATAAGSVLNVLYTSNGTGVTTGTTVTVWIRPYGMKGDATSAPEASA